VTLGLYCFIGAGSLVNRNVPDYAIVAGNPARQIGWSCECGERLTENLDCLACGKQYEKKAGELEKIS
jgi:UDP-2-acetamido-3-amino-2,3-dideoxy-glucuronate N-acetyltransferase